MIPLKQSTTSQEILLGPFLDDDDGTTAKTGLSIANTDIKLYKKGGTDLVSKNSGGATECTYANGYYYATLDDTDTNTVGELLIFCKPTDCLPVKLVCVVYPANVYDSLFGGTDKLDVNVEEWNATAVPAEHTAGYPIVTVKDGTGTGEIDTTSGGVLVSSIAANAITSTAIATGAIDADSIASGAITSGKFAAGAIDAAAIATNAIDDDALSADAVTAIQSGLATAAELLKVPKSDGTSSWNATALAAIQSECNDALVAYDPPTKAELDSAVLNVSVDEIQASALADLFNTDSGTTYAAAVAGSPVKEIADNAGGSSLTADQIADAVWDELATGHTDAGKAGQQLWTDLDAILDDTGTAGVIVASINAGAINAAAIATGAIDADAIADNAIDAAAIANGSLTSIKFADDFITAAKLASDAGTEIATAVWASASRQLTALDEDVTTIDLNNSAVGSVVGNVGGNVVGSVGSLGTTAKADVNAEVVDALGTDVIAEMAQGVPAATPTIKQALMYLYMAWRNESLATSSLLSVKNDAGTVICKATLSDDGSTFTKAEFVSGP